MADDYQPRTKPDSFDVDGGWLTFQNDSQETVPPFGVIRVSSMEQMNGVTWYKCRKPDATFSRFYAINGPREVAYRRRGRCKLFAAHGLDALYSDAATPELLAGWGPKLGEWKLFKGYPGFTVIGQPRTVKLGRGAGTERKLVRVIQQPGELLAMTDGVITKGASGDCSIYAGTAGSEVDTGMNVTAWNRFDTVDGEKWVGIFWTNNAFYLGQKEC